MLLFRCLIEYLHCATLSLNFACGKLQTYTYSDSHSEMYQIAFYRQTIERTKIKNVMRKSRQLSDGFECI